MPRDRGSVLRGPGSVLRGPGSVLLAPGSVFNAVHCPRSGTTSDAGWREGISVLRDHGSVLRGPGSVLRGPGSVLRGPGSVLRAPGSVLRGPGSLLRAPWSVLHGLGSVLRGPGSVLLASWSVLRGPGSVLRASGSVRRAAAWPGSAAASRCRAPPAARARSAAWLGRSAPATHSVRCVRSVSVNGQSVPAVHLTDQQVTGAKIFYSKIAQSASKHRGLARRGVCVCVGGGCVCVCVCVCVCSCGCVFVRKYARACVRELVPARVRARVWVTVPACLSFCDNVCVAGVILVKRCVIALDVEDEHTSPLLSLPS